MPAYSSANFWVYTRKIEGATLLQPKQRLSDNWSHAAQDPRAEVEPDAGLLAADDALMARLRDGDQRALAKLITQYGPAMHALAFRFTANRADAEEIVQDGFLQLWKKSADWKPGAARLSTWLYQVIYFRCIDHDRAKKRRAWLSFGDEDNQVADRLRNPEQTAGDRKELQQLRADIRTLPARQRAVLLMSTLAEKSHAEIAEITGLSNGAIEQLLVRARRTLRARQSARDQINE